MMAQVRQKLAPGQAESWEKKPNDDGTVTYTFKLRDGIKWSDGKDVTAQTSNTAGNVWQARKQQQTIAT